MQHYVVQAVDNLLTKQGPWTPALRAADIAAKLMAILQDSQVPIRLVWLCHQISI